MWTVSIQIADLGTNGNSNILCPVFAWLQFVESVFRVVLVHVLPSLSVLIEIILLFNTFSVLLYIIVINIVFSFILLSSQQILMFV